MKMPRGKVRVVVCGFLAVFFLLLFYVLGEGFFPADVRVELPIGKVERAEDLAEAIACLMQIPREKGEDTAMRKRLAVRVFFHRDEREGGEWREAIIDMGELFVDDDELRQKNRGFFAELFGDEKYVLSYSIRRGETSARRVKANHIGETAQIGFDKEDFLRRFSLWKDSLIGRKEMESVFFYYGTP